MIENPTHDNIRGYYGSIVNFPSSLGVLLCELRPDIDTLLCSIGLDCIQKKITIFFKISTLSTHHFHSHSLVWFIALTNLIFTFTIKHHTDTWIHYLKTWDRYSVPKKSCTYICIYNINNIPTFELLAVLGCRGYVWRNCCAIVWKFRRGQQVELS